MTFTLTCPDCGKEFEITKAEIKRGILFWSRCQSCRPKDESESEEAA